MAREKKANYVDLGDYKQFKKMLEGIEKEHDGRFLTKTLEKMFVYLLDIKTESQFISTIIGKKEEDLIRITRERMLKEILHWDDDAVQIEAPFLRIAMPLLLELEDILNDQLRTRKLKADMWKK